MNLYPQTIIKMLVSKPSLNQLSPLQVKFITAMRITAMARIKKIDASKYLVKYFGDGLSARYFGHIIETIEDCWPEPFQLNKACAAITTYDEMLIADLIRSVSEQRIEFFHGLLCEMLSKSECERLHHNISRFIESTNDHIA